MNRIVFEKIILIFAIVVLLSFSVFAKENLKDNSRSDWGVKITSDTKDLTLGNTEDIQFIVEDNPYVVSGKMAPGSTAIAKIDVDLTNVKSMVDMKLDIKDGLKELPFELTTYLNGEKIESGEKILLIPDNNKEFSMQDGKQEITLKLVWQDGNAYNQTVMGDRISIPVKITVEEHI